jgi:hypothetical protein
METIKVTKNMDIPENETIDSIGLSKIEYRLINNELSAEDLQVLDNTFKYFTQFDSYILKSIRENKFLSYEHFVREYNSDKNKFGIILIGAVKGSILGVIDYLKTVLK